MSSSWQLLFTDLKSRSQHLLTTKILSDCTFLVGQGTAQSVEGHKLIFSIASPVFYEKLIVAEGVHPKITISDVEPEIFELIVKYVYTDTVDTDANTVYDLAAAADTYQLPGLLKICFNTITATNLTSKNVLQTYSLSLHASENVLKVKCEEFLRNNIKDVLADSSFEEACFDVVEGVFSLENLNIDSELELLNAADRYKKHVSTCKETNELSIRNLLAKIRFLSLTPEEFVKGQSMTSVLLASDAYAILANIAYDKSEVPMPSGFSLIRDPRKSKVNVFDISEIRFKFTVPDIEKLLSQNQDATSPTFMLRNMKWKIMAGKKIKNSESFLAIFAYCNWESTSEWSCNARVDMHLLQADKVESLEKKIYSLVHKFQKSESNRGYDNMLPISDLLNPKNKYTIDGAITFEIYIKADEPQGL